MDARVLHGAKRAKSLIARRDAPLRLALLGSTGSIGRQTLEVAAAYPDAVRIVALAADQNYALLFEQARQFMPALCALRRPPKDFLPPDGINCEWVLGDSAPMAAATFAEADAVLVAVVGAAGLLATLAAIEAGKTVLLANKETLVAGGSVVMEAAKRRGVAILPVDSEHSAIKQCLEGAKTAPQKLILTASGGPFRTWNRDQIYNACPADALRHPSWKMGPKITVDCASLMNKGLEVIEAHWLFNMPPERIDVVVHPQSIVHSLVQFPDGALLAQLGVPDMRVPIAWAISYPQRLTQVAPPPNLAELGSLAFEKPDAERFPCLRLAYEALNAAGIAPAALNAANEEAVAHFLDFVIPFGRIPELVEDALNSVINAPASLEAILAADEAARACVARALGRRLTFGATQ